MFPPLSTDDVADLRLTHPILRCELRLGLSMRFGSDLTHKIICKFRVPSPSALRLPVTNNGIHRIIGVCALNNMAGIEAMTNVTGVTGKGVRHAVVSDEERKPMNSLILFGRWILYTSVAIRRYIVRPEQTLVRIASEYLCNNPIVDKRAAKFLFKATLFVLHGRYRSVRLSHSTSTTGGVSCL